MQPALLMRMIFFRKVSSFFFFFFFEVRERFFDHGKERKKKKKGNASPLSLSLLRTHQTDPSCGSSSTVGTPSRVAFQTATLVLPTQKSRVVSKVKFRSAE